MGERKQRRDRFFAENPFCCFCGGETEATTIDHVPNRASFPGRQAPEGFEFPACDACQTDSRLDEIAFSNMVYFLAGDGDLPDEAATRRLLLGLKNNLPHLARIQNMSANEKRRAVQDLQIDRGGGSFAELPMIKIDKAWHAHLTRYLAKLSKALFYKHVGKPAGRDHVTWNQWTYEKIGLNRTAILEWIEMTPIVEIGRRSNVDLGERFHYRVNYSSDLGAFAVVGKFGKGLVFYVLVLEPSLAARLDSSVGARLKQEG